tara:strand:+ start:97 stop:297 length:201 start_codon:yes stop_codon:yes gene_type:complete
MNLLLLRFKIPTPALSGSGFELTALGYHLSLNDQAPHICNKAKLRIERNKKADNFKYRLLQLFISL